MKKVGPNQYKKMGEFLRVEAGPVGTSGGLKHMCNDCLHQFDSAQGLGSHRVNCESAIARKSKEESVFQQDLQDNHDTIVILCKTQENSSSRKRRLADKPSNIKHNSTRKHTRLEDRSASLGIITIDSSDDDDDDDNNEDEVVAAAPPSKRHDNRKTNRGCAKRMRYSSRHNVDWVNEVDKAMNQDPEILTFVAYCSEQLLCSDQEVIKLSNNYYSWRKRDVYRECLRDVLGLAKNKSGSLAKRSKATLKSLYHEIETALYSEFVNQRKKGRKVSSSWIRIYAMKIYNAKKLQYPRKWESTNFKASFGWMRRFIARKRIKFRKRKCGKEKTAEECVQDFEEFMYKLRFDFLPPREDDGDDGRDPLWGRFPPEKRYNMDQVPLPFVVSQNDTFTMDDDNDVNIKCPREALQKRQFTMHQVFNAGKGDKAHGWCELVCRGTGKRIAQAETDLYDEDIEVFWQPKAWVDKVIMRNLAERFVMEKN